MLEQNPRTDPEEEGEGQDESEEEAVEGSGEEDDESEDHDEEDIPDIGDEPGTSSRQIANPMFEGSDDSDSDDSDMSDSDDSDDSDNDGEKSKPEKAAGFDEEDDLIAALKSAREKKVRDSPPDIKLKESATDISFHPEEGLIVVGNIQGEISVFRYSNEENKLEKKLRLHKGGLRCVEYNLSGDRIISGGKDKTIKVIDAESWSVLYKDLTHPSPLYTVAPLQNGAVSGDEDGTVKLWDFRTQKSVMTSKRFDEFVSSFHTEEEKQRIIAASGEGTIQSWDLRMHKPDTQSEVYSSELNTLAVVREGTKLVVGSGEGVLYLFNQGQYGYHSDQYPGHPDSINHMLGVTDNVVLTGCEDGTIRAVHLYPHRFIGQVGHHEGEMPVERMDVNAVGDIIASIGHDNRVKFWNIAYLEKMEYEKKRKPLVNQKNMKPKKKRLTEAVAREDEHQLPSSGRINKQDFFKGFQ